MNKPKYKVGDFVHAFAYDSVPIEVLAIKKTEPIFGKWFSYELKRDDCGLTAWVHETEIDDK